MKTKLLLFALLIWNISGAQEDSTDIFWVDYAMEAHYKKDPYTKDNMYLSHSDPTGGVMYSDLRFLTDSLGRDIKGIFAFFPNTWEEGDDVNSYYSATIQAVGDERERDFYVQYQARDLSWKIEVWTHKNQVKVFENLDEDFEYSYLTIYYLK